MKGIAIHPAIHALQGGGLWLAVAGLTALPVAQRRPRPNEALREDDMAADSLPAGTVDGVRRLPS